jgi:Ribosomal L29 protein.
MKVSELREKTNQELNELLLELRKEQFNLAHAKFYWPVKSSTSIWCGSR